MWLQPPTGGAYTNVFSASDGVIVALANFSPLSEARRNPVSGISPEQRLPIVNHWSDVVANLWNKHAGDRAQGLKTIIRQNVQDDATKELLKEVLFAGRRTVKSGYLKTSQWPGETVRTSVAGQHEFFELLGSPYGRGVANMLLRHPDKIGKKSVNGITVWTSGGESGAGDHVKYHMWFRLVDA